MRVNIMLTLETKSFYTKDEAIVRMVTLGETMTINKGSQFYCYRNGLFYVSSTNDFKESRELNLNDLSLVVDFIKS